MIDKEKSLAYRFPELAKEWHPTKNGVLTPSDITYGSKQIVWWKCKIGHEWQTSANNRQRGEGCPYCSNKKVLPGYNDILTTDPIVAKEWNYEKNGDILPTMVGRGSAKKVWWRCEKGHEWQALVYARTKGNTGCPYCCNQKILTGYNDLSTVNPQLAAEWNFEKNGDLLPSEVAPFNNKKVWWKCKEGHQWQAAISDRQRGNGCPYCSGSRVLKGFNDLATKAPDLAKEWNYERNNPLTPFDVTCNSGKKVWWRCEKGHEWQAQIASRNWGNGCPQCANELQSSFPEKIVFYYLSKFFENAVENYKPDWLRPMELDIYIPSRNIAIEYDGRNWHKDSSKDNKKNQLCLQNGVTLYRLREDGCAHIDDISINFTLTNIKADGSHVVSGLLWLSKQLGINIDIDLERDSSDIHQLINYSNKSKSLSTPELLQSWNYERNGNLSPEKITNHSGKKVWWKCEKGHEWQAIVSDRQRGDGCPYCSGNRVLKGFNDVFTTNPSLIEEWDYEKNQHINPYDLSKGSSVKVWWRCKEGHSYKSAVATRTSGVGCPICDGKVILAGYNDLMTKNPQLAAEWNYDRNGKLTPDQVAPFSNKKVWWKCEKGHEWESKVASRNKNSNCPYCGNQKLLSGFNDLATRFPELALDWDYTKNEQSPSQVLASDKSKKFWICKKCGHSYEKSVYNKVRSPKCPKCKK